MFQRSFQGVALTEKGEKFLEISRRIVEQLETIPAIAQDPKTAPVANIAAVPAACNSLVIELIQQMRRDRPDTIINIQELRPTKVLRPLAEGEADLAIGIHIPSIRDKILRQVEQADLQIEEVFRDTMCVYLPKNHPLAKKKSISRQELAKDTPIFFSDYIRLDQNDANGEEIQSSRNYFSFTDQASMKRQSHRGWDMRSCPGRWRWTTSIFPAEKSSHGLWRGRRPSSPPFWPISGTSPCLRK